MLLRKHLLTIKAGIGRVTTMSKLARLLVGVGKAYYPQQKQHSRFPGRARCGGKGRLTDC